MEGSAAIARLFGQNLRRAGLHRTEIGLLERGARVPRIDTLLKLAAALGVSLRCPLLDRIEWRPGSSAPGGFAVASPAEDAPPADPHV
jgi:transcriptional regulator with XRE-family HTH domain